MTEKGSGQITIKVKTLKGSEFKVTVDSNLTAAELKNVIQEKEGVPADKQRIIYKYVV